MKIFKESKKQPIKFRGFKYIGFDENHPNVCYYYKELARNNFEIMTCCLEGERKPEIGSGTNVNVIDCFMASYLKYGAENYSIEKAVEDTFYDYDENAKKAMIKKYNSKIPKELKLLVNQVIKNGAKVLYCSNDEALDRKLGVVNLVFVKDEHIKSKDERLGIDKHYIVFEPKKFMTSMSYLKGENVPKYIEVPLREVVIDSDLLK
jgi:hypothetical protein